MDDSKIAAGNTQYVLEASYGVWIQGSPQKQKNPLKGVCQGQKSQVKEPSIIKDIKMWWKNKLITLDYNFKINIHLI